MRPEEKKRLYGLFAVLAVVVVILIYTNTDILSAKPVANTTMADINVAKLSAEIEALGGLPALAVDKPGSDEAYEFRRNLFEYTRSPVEIRKMQEEAAEAARQRKLQEERARKQAEEMAKLPPPEPPPPPPPQPPAFRYVYTGQIIQQRGGTEDVLAFLSRGDGNKKDLLPVKVGDVIDNSFVIQKIDDDTIVIGYKDPQFKDRAETIRLVKTAPSR